MAIFQQSFYLNLPSVDYPLSEEQQVLFLVGYYSGTSFRCIWRHTDYDKAFAFARESSQLYGRTLVVFRVVVNVQRLPDK